MSERLSLLDLGKVDLVPQAMAKLSTSTMDRDLGIAFDRDSDDLDACSAAFFRTNAHVFAFIRYDGEPEDNVTIYLERSLSPTDVGEALARIAEEFGIPNDRIVWREMADPRAQAG
jgi:hypothetical protein